MHTPKRDDEGFGRTEVLKMHQLHHSQCLTNLRLEVF